MERAHLPGRLTRLNCISQSAKAVSIERMNLRMVLNRLPEYLDGLCFASLHACKHTAGRNYSSYCKKASGLATCQSFRGVPLSLSLPSAPACESIRGFALSSCSCHLPCKSKARAESVEQPLLASSLIPPAPAHPEGRRPDASSPGVSQTRSQIRSRSQEVFSALCKIPELSGLSSDTVDRPRQVRRYS